MKPDAADVCAARQAWLDADQAWRDMKEEASRLQQRYFAIADQHDRVTGPTSRRLAREAEITRLEAALKEFSDER